MSVPPSQALFTRLLAGAIGEIVGEEDESTLDISAPPFRAGAITAPAELEAMIVQMRERFDGLAASLPKAAEYKDLVAFIDPIDGTKEFCTGKGEQCSICVGFAGLATGEAVAGIVYRPLCPIKSWALGCKGEGLMQSSLQQREQLGDGAFLCSNGGTSGFLDCLRAELGFTERPQGGAGNKALRVLEEPRGCYIQDRGVSRWDTCAAQAVLEAHGGMLVQLHPLASGAADAPPTVLPYRYVKGAVNANFVPGLVPLSKYNAASGTLSADELAKGKGAPPRYATSAEQLKPYANTLGLFAIRHADPENLEAARAAILRAAAQKPPAFD